jgi:hypothetical protein
MPFSSSPYLIRYILRTPVGAMAAKLIAAFKKPAAMDPYLTIRGFERYLPSMAMETALVTAIR